MGHTNIDIQQLSVEDRNKFLLGHFIHTWKGRISDDTLYQHVLNLQYFIDSHLSDGVVGVHDEPRSLDQATAYDVYDFITDWLPRKGWVVFLKVQRRAECYPRYGVGGWFLLFRPSQSLHRLDMPQRWPPPNLLWLSLHMLLRCLFGRVVYLMRVLSGRH